jgi:hypothetical protein
VRREHVEDAAAHRDLAALLDERHPRIARADQRRDERVAVDRLAELEVHGAPAHELARGHARRERGPRRHDDRAGSCGAALSLASQRYSTSMRCATTNGCGEKRS